MLACTARDAPTGVTAARATGRVPTFRHQPTPSSMCTTAITITPPAGPDAAGPDTRPKKRVPAASQRAETAPAPRWLCFVKHSLLVRLLGVLRPALPCRCGPTPARSLDGLEGGERAVELRIDGLLVAEPSLGRGVVRHREARRFGLQREGFCSHDGRLALHEVCASLVENLDEGAPSPLFLRLVV